MLALDAPHCQVDTIRQIKSQKGVALIQCKKEQSHCMLHFIDCFRNIRLYLKAVSHRVRESVWENLNIKQEATVVVLIEV